MAEDVGFVEDLLTSNLENHSFGDHGRPRETDCSCRRLLMATDAEVCLIVSASKFFKTQNLEDACARQTLSDRPSQEEWPDGYLR
jgi:hypothetical protein